MLNTVEEKAINTIRTLSIDSINRANSGHPGLPMGAAPMAFALWTRHLKHEPDNPTWWDRDRFVLSAGHGSMLLYSLLHLSGYDLSMEELKNFRQWGSKTPGHPEYGHTPGVDATTGPLGQGLAMAVGMAMAESHLSAVYNTSKHELFDHYTYALCGDGDVMEGVASESASLAGHLGLGKLVVLYDSNDISLDGDLNRSFSEDVMARYDAYGWHTILVEDGSDVDAIDQAIADAKADPRPSLIEIKTVIGFGSPNRAGTNEAHGKALGADETVLVKESYKWEHDEFHVPEEVASFFASLKENNKKQFSDWESTLAAYEQDEPKKAEELRGAFAREWFNKEALLDLPAYEVGKDKLATRKASGEMISAISKQTDALFGGSADLASSNNTMMNDHDDFTKDNRTGRNVWFGVREFATAAAVNGIALHGGLHPYGATFLVFSDYMRPAVRLSALMNVPSTFVFTHDSVAVGEDGPTHEPVEQTSSLRMIPNLNVLRPADGNETAAAWRIALESKGTPTALVLTRQGLPTLISADQAYEQVKNGAYVLAEAEGAVATLLATGSEVSLAMDAQKQLKEQGTHVRVVSMPSQELFEQTDRSYQEDVLPANIPVLSIEAGTTYGWQRYTGRSGANIGIDTFGASAPGDVVMDEYGFNVENVITHVNRLIK
ncbi:transketolase [Geomicrobium sp. JCM 19039]|uniref:transketolase n=1 Tax=Geomicrobium sp. JCM 19039 TaxID=1460636 RepID=UPI00045F3D2A|nr:transketolase [Geomicrobium sp. JCM 19039]GAK11014.1 transketolase [Geomicrobium sp. JCM 19039]